MTKFYNYINEKSYTNKDIPDYFYVVFDLENAIEGLKKREFKNMKGISSSNEIEFQFLGVARDAMLKMDSKELLDINKITRINYEKPEFLVSKNMWALRRMYSARKTGWVNQVFGNIFDTFKKTFKKYNSDKILHYDMDYYGFRNIDYDWAKQIESKLKIKNIKDLAIVIDKYIKNIFSKETNRVEAYKYTIKEIYNALYETLKHIGKIYASEAEWVIKDTTFKIPKKSELIILVPHFKKFNQKAYDLTKEYLKDKSLDDYTRTFDIGLTVYLRDHGETLEKGESTYSYSKLAKIEKLLEPIENKYKIIKLDNALFKAKQEAYWREN